MTLPHDCAANVFRELMQQVLCETCHKHERVAGGTECIICLNEWQEYRDDEREAEDE